MDLLPSDSSHEISFLNYLISKTKCCQFFFVVSFIITCDNCKRAVSDERSFYRDPGKKQFKWIHDAADNSHEMSFLIWFLLKDSNKL